MKSVNVAGSLFKSSRLTTTHIGEGAPGLALD
jgi:hypothetical protein